ncbi:high mobility group B protein 6 [Telopea speciosissima]|uniref:high mobility group B protein 6 n=1 Tax=Telopea speciosissima TaxID=54955 RepID=UPI001CC70A76|nr:high mobility group B protein 6 [Telopea speciosissima]
MEELLSCQSPAVGPQNIRQKISRRPLQPRNFLVDPIDDQLKTNSKPKRIEISLAGDSDKENRLITSTPSKNVSLDASLAEELSSIRKKLERLRLEKEKTEKKLREKDLLLDMHLMELQRRGESQKQVEIMVEKLLALKKLQFSCIRITPIQSLREKEQEKKLKEVQLHSKEMKSDERECANAMEREKFVDRKPELDPSADEVPEKAPDS